MVEHLLEYFEKSLILMPIIHIKRQYYSKFHTIIPGGTGFQKPENRTFFVILIGFKQPV